jgi:hypothetical protein
MTVFAGAGLAAFLGPAVVFVAVPKANKAANTTPIPERKFLRFIKTLPLTFKKVIDLRCSYDYQRYVSVEEGLQSVDFQKSW